MSCYDFYAHLKELPWEVKRRDSHGKAKESCVIKSEWESKFAKRGLGTQVSRISMLSASGIGNTYKFLVCPDTENRNVDISALLSIQVGVGHYLEAVKNEMDLESEFDDAVAFGLIPAADNASALIDVLSGIPYSFVLSFAFTLAKPYLSRDDRAFYAIDNPVKKDMVTGLPYVAATSWKGAFRRAALRVELEFPKEDADRRAVRRGHRELFGHEQGAEGKHKDFAEYLDKLIGGKPDDLAGESRRGRLLFYPSFFQTLGVEVINKRNRETGAGTFPIYFECVPVDAKAMFTLIYVPFDLVGKNGLEIPRAVSRDLKTVAATLPELLLTSGVGAKTAEDYGIAKDDLKLDKNTVDGKCPSGQAKPTVRFRANWKHKIPVTATTITKLGDELAAIARELDAEEGRDVT